MEAMASSGAGSMFSMASEKSLPISANVVTVSASIPANGPMLTQATNTLTYTSASIERVRLRKPRVNT